MSPLPLDPTPLTTPQLRLSAPSDLPPRPEGEVVLYWMTAQRRTRYNFGLQRALWWCATLQRPLVVLEALRVGYEWASDRHHAFVIDGMRDNAAAFAAAGVAYHGYVEHTAGEGRGLLEAHALRACVVVADEYPCFFLPRMLAAAATRLRALGRRLELVDSNGLLPLRATDRAFTTAASFRRHLQKTLLPHMGVGGFPRAEPLMEPAAAAGRGGEIPAALLARWPSLVERPVDLAALPIDHGVAPCARGGSARAAALLGRFVEVNLRRYHEARNDIDDSAATGLSAHLHFGHISPHEVVEVALRSCGWSPARVASSPSGSREGWWGASAGVEAFLDEQITWRELGFVMCFHHPQGSAAAYDRYESLPGWALETLDEHRADPRAHVYSLEQLDGALTHDRLWNAAQRQLVREGRVHNYLRMLWGKKILEWSPTPEEALRRLVWLNNRYALDGRDPNSYSGIFWCLGRFDRAWGPERPVYGKVRYMTSDSTARKYDVKGYLARYS